MARFLWRFANAYTGRQAVRYGERQRAGASIKGPPDQGSRSLTLPVPYRRSLQFPVPAIAIGSRNNPGQELLSRLQTYRGWIETIDDELLQDPYQSADHPIENQPRGSRLHHPNEN